MGFCRRCGEIVTGAKCRCGGGAVAAVVQWNQVGGDSAPKEDRWSKTYTRAKPTAAPEPEQPPSTPSPTKRFPRPNSSAGGYSGSGNTQLGSRVSAHIASTTSYRPPSPLKHSSSVTDESNYNAEEGILPAPNSASLIKVHGSILERNLATHCCSLCATSFAPDATIYPDPRSESTSKFVCKRCFTENGGSKGTCPTCSRPVLTLKSEGGFIQAAGKVWHKRCFRCEGCYKDIGETPMVDLLGHPTCADCFDSCLKRETKSPRRPPLKDWEGSPRGDKSASLGGMSMGRKSREGSPAIEELEQRLGISKPRESTSSNALDDLSSRLSFASQRTPVKDHRSPAPSPSPAAASIRGPPNTSRYSQSRDNSPMMDRVRVRAQSGGEFASAFAATRAAQNSPTPARRSFTRDSEMGSPRGAGSPSPVRSQLTGGGSPMTKPTEDAIEEMKRRFLRGGSASPAPSPTTTPLRISRGRTRSPPARSPATSSPIQSATSRIPVRSSMGDSPTPHRYSGSPSTSFSVPPTPDLMSDVSDAPSEGTDSPPRSDIFGPGDHSFSHEEEDVIRSLHSTPTHKAPPSKLHGLGLINLPKPMPADSGCAKCGRALFTTKDGGKFVTVPEDPGNGRQPKTYHTSCFKCVVCEGVFREGGKGQAVFVRAEAGPCHVECAPPEKINYRPIPSKTKSSPAFSFKDIELQSPQSTTLPLSKPSFNSPSLSKPSSNSPASSSSRTLTWTRPPASAPATSSSRSFPRFGGGTACPGCHKAVSSMEFGVVPGPQGSRWHASCLVCGGKVERGRGSMWSGRDRDKDKPGCGKKLDSAAKTDGDGGVWCRECSLLLPVGMRGDSPAGSPTRSSPALVPMYTGGRVAPHHTGPRIAPQFTGTTTIARQFTGMGALERQMTGGGLSPTRQLTSSPTKQFDGPGSSTARPRPRSVIGMRSSKSIDFGRGMMLVKQLTGGAEGR